MIGPETKPKLERFVQYMKKHKERAEWLAQELGIDPGDADRLAFEFERSEHLAELSHKVDCIQQNTKLLPGFIQAVFEMVTKFTGDLKSHVIK